MKELAIEQQQCFYELLCDFAYNPDEHKYLKQNIGYAIYGPPEPTNNENANATERNGGSYSMENQTEDADIFDTVNYNEKAKAVINIIYNKIREQTDCTKTIYVGIIYNVIYNLVGANPKKKEKKEDETKKETEVKKEEKLPIVIPIPIFKIFENTQENIATSAKQNMPIKTEVNDETWYIDTSGRVYKSWIDYKDNNKLPECTMVLPKDGRYQADPSYPITEEYSTVWLEIVDSPACAWATKLSNGMDIASSVSGIAAIGLGIASLFTPLAPVVAITGNLQCTLYQLYNSIIFHNDIL